MWKREKLEEKTKSGLVNEHYFIKKIVYSINIVTKFIMTQQNEKKQKLCDVFVTSKSSKST